MSKGNSWCKKLMHKQKVFAMREKLGNEKGVAAFCARAKPVTARSLERETIEDKPAPKGVVVRELKPLPQKARFRTWSKKITPKEVRGFDPHARDARLNAQASALIKAMAG